MSLRELKFLADENINYIVVAYLREQGTNIFFPISTLKYLLKSANRRKAFVLWCFLM